MAGEKKAAKASSARPATTTRKTGRSGKQDAIAAERRADGFTADERAAMKARAREMKAEARANRTPEDGERELLAAIAEMPAKDRTMAKRLHAIIGDVASGLVPKTWYGMPAWAKDGKVVCFFQSAQKFKYRYATFGFSDTANLDDGAMWPTAFALRADARPGEEDRCARAASRAMTADPLPDPDNERASGSAGSSSRRAYRVKPAR